MKIPPHYLPVMPYLVIRDAKAFLEYSKIVFGATDQLVVPDPNDDQRIMHAEIKIHNAVIMIGQANENWKEKTAGMFLFVENLDAVYEKAIQNKSSVLMEPATQDYGYSAGFEDPFGNTWWIAQGETE